MRTPQIPALKLYNFKDRFKAISDRAAKEMLGLKIQIREEEIIDITKKKWKQPLLISKLTFTMHYYM